MTESRALFLVTCVLIFLLKITPVLADKTAEKSALEASDSWLALVDSGQYAKSWQTAAALFKNSLTQEQWSQSLKAARKPLGRVIRRSTKSKQYTTNLPGAADGEYVVIQYETVFENKKSSVETVTPMLDKDGKWRVSGYYIR